jgi:hypothetical protein
MQSYVLNIITVLHVMFIIFVVSIPFTNSNYFLTVHAILIPFLMLHWITQDNSCVLTLVERYVRYKINGGKVDEDEEENCFTCKLIEPIYSVNQGKRAEWSMFLYTASILLWLVSAGKLICGWRTGRITSVEEFFLV